MGQQQPVQHESFSAVCERGCSTRPPVVSARASSRSIPAYPRPPAHSPALLPILASTASFRVSSRASRCRVVAVARLSTSRRPFAASDRRSSLARGDPYLQVWRLPILGSGGPRDIPPVTERCLVLPRRWWWPARRQQPGPQLRAVVFLPRRAGASCPPAARA